MQYLKVSRTGRDSWQVKNGTGEIVGRVSTHGKHVVFTLADAVQQREQVAQAIKRIAKFANGMWIVYRGNNRAALSRPGKVVIGERT